VLSLIAIRPTLDYLYLLLTRVFACFFNFYRRATAQQIALQGESLSISEAIAENTDYMLQKSARILRGMTWSGWVANIFTSDVKCPSVSAATTAASTTKEEDIIVSMEDCYLCYEKEKFSQDALSAVHSVMNYHLHVILLFQQCKAKNNYNNKVTIYTEKERRNDNIQTCFDVCLHLQNCADVQLKSLRSLKNKKETSHAVLFLSNKMIQLGAMIKQLEDEVSIRSHQVPLKLEVASKNISSTLTRDATSIMINSGTNPRTLLLQQEFQAQEDHLSSLIPGLEELKNISHAIGTSIVSQNETLDSLHNKAEDLTEKTKLVVRRSERMIQQKNLFIRSPVFLQCEVRIQHLPTERYVMVVDNGLLEFSAIVKQATRFNLWKTQGNLYGFQNSITNHWLGQSTSIFLPGKQNNIVCNASSFGQREQWELDEDYQGQHQLETRLLCASANWGAGGWIKVLDNGSIKILGDNSNQGKKDATLWRIVPCC